MIWETRSDRTIVAVAVPEAAATTGSGVAKGPAAQMAKPAATPSPVATDSVIRSAGRFICSTGLGWVIAGRRARAGSRPAAAPMAMAAAKPPAHPRAGMTTAQPWVVA